jgi:hypothetical protein
MKLFKGTIKDLIQGSPMNVGFLIVQREEDNLLHIVGCDYVKAVSAFDHIYNEVISPEGEINTRPIFGKTVYYSTNDKGFLYGLTPTEFAGFDLMAAYGYYKGREVENEQEQQGETYLGAGMN